MINKREILFAPEIGDWALYKPKQSKQEAVVGNVGVSEFDRLSKDDFKSAQDLHYRAFEKLKATLIQMLQVKVDFYAVESTQLPYQQFCESVKGRVLQGMVTIADNIQFKIYFEHYIANALMDRGMGGEGRSSDKPLSEIEHALFVKIIEKVLVPFLPLWGISADQVKVTNVHSDVTEDYFLTSQSSYVTISGKYGVSTSKAGKITFGYSRDAVNTLLQRAGTEVTGSQGNLQLNKKTLKNIDLNLKVDIGSTNITMKDLMALSEGDVIKLDTSINSPLVANTEDGLFVSCVPGVFNSSFAVQVMSLHRNKDELEALKQDDWDGIQVAGSSELSPVLESAPEALPVKDVVAEPTPVESIDEPVVAAPVDEQPATPESGLDLVQEKIEDDFNLDDDIDGSELSWDDEDEEK